MCAVNFNNLADSARLVCTRQEEACEMEERYTMVRAVVGANWGDEGKGKITDMLGQESDIIVRFQGGANAGHTIVNDYGKVCTAHPAVRNLLWSYDQCHRKRCGTEHSGVFQ